MEQNFQFGNHFRVFKCNSMELVNCKQVFSRKRDGMDVEPKFKVREGWPNENGCFFNLPIDNPTFQAGVLPLMYEGKPHYFVESYLGGGFTNECQRALLSMQKAKKNQKLLKIKEEIERG